MVRLAGISALIFVGFFLTTLGAAWAQPEVTQGTLQVVTKPGEKLLEFPLEHTDVEAYIAGMVAHVTVTQRFGNPYDKPIEAVYVFPLPHNAAVNDMVMKVGDRTIRGLIKKREEAKQIYEEAKAAGKHASLLEQERPNIFTQSVANIMPGDRILITITYDETLNYEDGRYDFVFPMVVGPRFIPGAPLPGPSTGGGWSPDTTEVPDASRITPPVLRPEERSGHDIDLSVYLDAGVPIGDLRSKSHQISPKRLGPSAYEAHLKPGDRIPNKDFVLSYDVAGRKPEMALLTHRGDAGGFFMLMLQPKSEPTVNEITPREMVFVVDCSGSMSNFPIERAKSCMRRCLQSMHPKDTFQIIRFSNAAECFAPGPVPNTPDNVTKGLAYVDAMAGRGGTMMIEGVKAALDYPPDPGRMRIVFFMTDGYIGNEVNILAAIEEKVGDARLFSLGVGTAVNRWLLDSMAKVGRGTVQYVRPDEDDAEVVKRFYAQIGQPYLTDIEIDWAGLEVSDVYPTPVRDLFAGQPIVVCGRYDTGGEATITVTARLAGKPWAQRMKIELPEVNSGNQALGTLWARRRIQELTSQMYQGEKPETVEQITNLALEFRLMSAYTSFVAVEEKVVNEGGELKTIQVPVPIPEMVSYEGVFGAGSMIAGMKGHGMRAELGATAPLPATASTAYGRAIRAIADLDDRLVDVGNFVRLAQSPFAVVMYQGEGWKTNDEGLLKMLAEASKVVNLGGAGHPGLITLERLAKLPEESNLKFLFLTGKEAATFSDEETKALADWLTSGGFLIVDSAGDKFYKSVTAALTEALPNAEFKRIADDHDVYRGAAMPYAIAGGCPIVEELNTAGPAQGLFIDGKLAVFISRGNLGSAWAAARDEKTELPYRMGTNLLSYALQR